MGRLGHHFWAFEQQGLKADIVVLGKPIGNGHPMGAVRTRGRSRIDKGVMKWRARCDSDDSSGGEQLQSERDFINRRRAQAAAASQMRHSFERSRSHLFSTMALRRMKPKANKPPTGPPQHGPGERLRA